MDADEIYDNLKNQGYSDEEISDGFIFSVHIERTEEEEKLWLEELSKARKKYWDSMTDEERIETKRKLNELAERFRKEDEENV